MVCPLLLALLAAQFGTVLYERGVSLYLYRRLIVCIQQSVAGVRPFMTQAWKMINRWEIVEPVTHRLPLPEPLYRAMITTSLIWGLLPFLGLLSWGSQDLVNPSVVCGAVFCCRVTSFKLELVWPTLKLKLLNPDEEALGGYNIFLSVTPLFVNFLESVYRDVEKDCKLFDGSASAFRRRWDAVLKSLGVVQALKLTPGGIRGGGCVAAFQRGVQLPMLMWKMRLKQQSTLEF